MPTKIRLVSFNLCPFVQRSVITLEEKAVPYEIEYIDLASRPEWFLKLSPFGKVPILQLDDSVIFESAVINEYLDETNAPAMMPADPLLRAKNRMWIEFCSTLVADSFMLSMKETREEAEPFIKKTLENLQRLNEPFVGPFFNGDAFSLVDAAVAPALQRISWCLKIDPSLNSFEDLPQMSAWTNSLLSRPSVQNSTVDGIEGIFHEFLAGKGSPTRHAPPSWLANMLR